MSGFVRAAGQEHLLQVSMTGCRSKMQDGALRVGVEFGVWCTALVFRT